MTEAVVISGGGVNSDFTVESPHLEETQVAATTDEGIADEIPHGDVYGDEEMSRLRALEAKVVDQDEIERNIGRQVRASTCNICARAVANNICTGRPCPHGASK